MTKRVFTPEQDKENTRLYKDEGLSLRAIAEMHGVDKSSVANSVKRAGVTPRTNRALTDAEEAEIAKLHETGGFAVYRIARTYGVSRILIKNAIRRQGVTRNDGRFVLTKDQEREIAKAYEAGQTIQ